MKRACMKCMPSYSLWVSLVLVVMVLQCRLSLASLTFANSSFSSLGPMRSEAIWWDNIHEGNVTIVNLIHDREIFDFCDLGKYTRENVEPLLSSLHVTNANNTRWAACVVFKDIYLYLPSLCPAASYKDSYILFDARRFSAYVERLNSCGGRGVIDEMLYRCFKEQYEKILLS